MAELKASIDIGSNTVLLLIAKVSERNFQVLESRSEVTALGKGIDVSKSFSEESMRITFEVLKDYASVISQYEIPLSSVIITATEASRVANNSKELFLKVERELGLSIQLISGAGEAYYTMRGIICHTQLNNATVVIMDIGGASTELIKVDTIKQKLIRSISMPIGSVRCSQWLHDGNFLPKMREVFFQYQSELDQFVSEELICVAGTMTSLGNMHLKNKTFVEDQVHNLQLSDESLKNLYDSYHQFDASEFSRFFPFLGKRSQSIRGGLYLSYHLINRLLVKKIKISTYGLRFGTILEKEISHEYRQ